MSGDVFLVFLPDIYLLLFPVISLTILPFLLLFLVFPKVLFYSTGFLALAVGENELLSIISYGSVGKIYSNLLLFCFYVGYNGEKGVGKFVLALKMSLVILIGGFFSLSLEETMPLLKEAMSGIWQSSCSLCKLPRAIWSVPPRFCWLYCFRVFSLTIWSSVE